MIKISGTQEEVDSFMDKMVCPINDDEGTLEEDECPHKDDLSNADCIQCLLDTYNIKLIFED